ncbi:hypothetical protein COY05_00850 [Candidatus Peregrinibacteria bacterium CG_4_10_14_0_2_um_filter_38_24]|nr:MAG: hypothetical protein COY05_00850 [Candidatus Peregrinibacteria bacterium CG_4_10_14_0_2_um_filter_38_24]PJC39380.1 MAG: hypothetical protein CO044_00155 [Candidatus Peregrinibacteria bacterium CG_4_9_14_0_2_um_filter_38_9]
MSEKNQKLECEKCKKEFLVIEQESNFYKRKGLPLPSICSECRRERRNNLRNKKQLFERTCDKCGTNLKSTYKKNSKFTVYCEKCYFDYMGGSETL